MHFIRRHPALAVLSTAQALYWSCSIIGITLTGLVGQQLTPWPLLATLPLALLVVGCLLTVTPMARWMQQHGARRSLQRGALLGATGGMLCAAAISWHSFVLFNIGALLVGGYQASAGYYRFVALEHVDANHQGRAAALVVAGGIAAALLAPSVALHSQQLLTPPMAGAYLALAALAGTAWLVLHALSTPNNPSKQSTSAQAATKTEAKAPPCTRASLWQRPAIRQALLVTACAHGLMVLVMNATPLAMHGHGHALPAAASVIQWHVLGMFVPSLWAGAALDRWGPQRVAAFGVAILAASALVALSGQAHAWYLVSSLLLGAGWNLMLLAGTRLLTLAYESSERSVAQPMMEWSNSAMAAAMSFTSGVLVQTLGWQAINIAMLPVLCLMAWWLRPAMTQDATTR